MFSGRLFRLKGSAGDLTPTPFVDGEHFESASAAPTFRKMGVLAGGVPDPEEDTSGWCLQHMGFGQRPRALLSSMGGALVLRHCRPLAVPRFCLLGGLVEGLQILLVLIIKGVFIILLSLFTWH